LCTCRFRRRRTAKATRRVGINTGCRMARAEITSASPPLSDRGEGVRLALACPRHPRLRPIGRPPHPPHTLRHYGAKHGKSGCTNGHVQCHCQRRQPNATVNTDSSSRKSDTLRDNGRNGSARASGKARTPRTSAFRRHRPLSADSRTPRDLRVPVRQWVLSFPIPVLLLFATHPQLLAPVLRIVHRVIATFLIQQAGPKRTEAHTGAVTLMRPIRGTAPAGVLRASHFAPGKMVIQRFGSAANLNKHA
jgi:hypothetical protein